VERPDGICVNANRYAIVNASYNGILNRVFSEISETVVVENLNVWAGKNVGENLSVFAGGKTDGDDFFGVGGYATSTSVSRRGSEWLLRCAMAANSHNRREDHPISRDRARRDRGHRARQKTDWHHRGKEGILLQ